MAAGLVSVLAGAAAAFAGKRAGLHPRAGRIYFVAFSIAFGALLALAIMRWPHNNPLLIIGAVTFGAATFGVITRRRGRRGWRPTHAVAMGTSYIGLLTGFYIDNGPHLPLWRELPEPLLWTLPTLVGVPILILALRRENHRRPARPHWPRARTDGIS